MRVEVKAYGIGPDTYALTCSECGLTGMCAAEEVDVACIKHLTEDHLGKRDTVEWKIGDGPWREGG